MSASEIIVSIDRVEKRFGAVHAVEEVSLDIHRGEFVSLLGPSGCGKSTILRMIAGFEDPTSGRILIDGVDVVRIPPNLRPVNMVFQSYALFPHLTAAENVAFGLKRASPGKARKSRSEIASETEKYLALVGLEGLGGRYPRQMSGGQQQRTALARALIKQPKVLLLDEPLGALDLKLRKRMQIELKQLQRELGITFIFVTHDQDEALSLSDSIAVMNAGAVVQYGKAREVYDSPRTAFVANFLGESNILSGRVESSSEKIITVDVAGQLFDVPNEDFLVTPGDQIYVSIRPEHLLLDATGTRSGVKGKVAEKSFLGNSFLVHVHIPSGPSVSLRGADRKEFDEVCIGQEVNLYWKPDSARVVLA
jgi:spermidine/putrescine ABC transporter ATP-binding subunit